MAEHNEFGKRGEALACEYLAGQGFQILEKNWRFMKDEVDVICKKDDALVFVEVKTRATDIFGEPEIAVTMKKQRFIIRAANAYIEKHDINIETRFDIVSVIIDGNAIEIKHIPDAFYPVVSKRK